MQNLATMFILKIIDFREGPPIRCRGYKIQGGCFFSFNLGGVLQNLSLELRGGGGVLRLLSRVKWKWNQQNSPKRLKTPQNCITGCFNFLLVPKFVTRVRGCSEICPGKIPDFIPPPALYWWTLPYPLVTIIGQETNYMWIICLTTKKYHCLQEFLIGYHVRITFTYIITLSTLKNAGFGTYVYFQEL